jgi:hypothetical protein
MLKDTVLVLFMMNLKQGYWKLNYVNFAVDIILRPFDFVSRNNKKRIYQSQYI